MLLRPIDSPVNTHTIIDGDTKLAVERAAKRLGVPQNAIINSLLTDGLIHYGYMKLRKRTTPKTKKKR